MKTKLVTLLETEGLHYPFEHQEVEHVAIIKSDGVLVPNIGEYNYCRTYTIYGNKQHYCGLQGFDPMLGDNCEACDDFHYKDTILQGLRQHLLREGILKPL